MQELVVERVTFGDQDSESEGTAEGSTAYLLSAPRVDTSALQERWSLSAPDQFLVAESLAWFAGLFGTPRARFVRILNDEHWVVQTLVHGKILVQEADYAEIAMAWNIGLSNEPLRVTRPRISQLDSDNIRPIAVTNYVGAPVICQGRFLGVFEAAGNIRQDAEHYLPRATTRLTELARRLVFDPELKLSPEITAETVVELGGGFAEQPFRLSNDEWSFVAVLGDPLPIVEIAEKTGLSERVTVDIARGLSTRGLIATSTG